MSSSQADLSVRRSIACAPAAQMMLVLLAGFLMTWPAWINGGPLLFFDSPGYIIQGRTAVEGTLAALSPPTAPEGAAGADGGGGDGAAGFGATAAKTEFIRSLGYSGFAFVASLSPLGAYGVALAQAILVAAVLAVLAGRDILLRPAKGAVAAGLVLLLTPLPWFASYLMPDILAAVPILLGIILVRRSRPGPLAFVLLLGAGTFACLSHYGHLPLAVAVGAAALLLLGLQRRLTLAALVLALAPPMLASTINAAGSVVAFKEASVAPKRLPILLARSIADGPARWHLEAECPRGTYAICELFGEEIPDDLRALLWSEGGLLKTATPELAERIREEEVTILSRAFLQHPFRQVWSLTGNALTQLVLVGTDDFSWGGLVTNPRTGRPLRQDEGSAGLDAVAAIHVAATLAGLGVLLVFAWRDRLSVGPREREMVLVLAIGLVANAAIFGGLSAPVDRYGSRVVWLVPMLAALFWLARRRAAGRAG